MASFIHEIYSSVSGEGITSGVPTVFIRIAGCSLRCGSTLDGRRLWCDTPYGLSPKAGKAMGLDDILQSIQSLNTARNSQILITGGEPLEGENRLLTIQIAQKYKEICLNIHHPFPRIETNGAESLRDLENMNFTMDYKLPGSGMEDRMCLENFEILNTRSNPLDEIKFVVRDRNDYERSLKVIREHKLSGWLLYSPVTGELDPVELAEWVKTNPAPGARLSLQIHKVLWGDKRGV